MIGLVDMIDQQCRHLEELTKGQAFSKLWIHYHCESFTASRLYEVVCTDPHKPAVSLVTSLCLIFINSTEYDKKHEKLAISAYKLATAKKHNNLKITSTGLILYRHRACFSTSLDLMLKMSILFKGGK